VRTTILGWSAVSGLVLGFIAGILLFAVTVVGSEMLSGMVPRIIGRARVAAAFVSFVLLPIAGAVIGLLEGRLKLR
jgi:hypothetical protein